MDFMTPLYVLAVYGAVRFFVRKPPSDAQAKPPHYTPLEALGVTMFIYFFSQLTAVLLFYGMPLLLGVDKQRLTSLYENNVLGQFGLIAVVASLTLYCLDWFLKRRATSYRTIGLGRRPLLKDIVYAVVAFFPYLVVLGLAFTVLQELAPSVNQDQEQQLGFNDPSGVSLVPVFIALAILPPIFEEILVRGFLYTGLKSKWKPWAAVLVTSALFGIAHLQPGTGEPLLWTAAIDTFVLSLFLIYLREKTGSLWASIFLHFIKNSVAFTYKYIVQP